MKFWKIAVLSLFVCSAAQADFLAGVLNMAVAKVDREKRVQARADELVERAMKVKTDNEKTAHAYANELLDEGAKLSILAQASNGGMGKDLSYAESGLNEKLPCGADLFATKEGVVTLILGKECGSSVSPADVRRQVEKLGLEKVYCEKNICQIDYVRK